LTKQNRLPDVLGLRLSRQALRVLKERGIYAHSPVSPEHQHLANRYVVRGLESGGAVGDLGRYVTFTREDGQPIDFLHPVEAIGVNGLHSVVVAPVSRMFSSIGNVGELRVGYEGGWEGFERQTGNPNLLPSFSGAYGDAKLQYRLDHLDNAVIPRKGQAADLTFLWSNASPLAPQQYPALQVASRNFFKLNEPSSVFLNGYGGTTFDYATGLPQFSLGGSQLLVAYGANEPLMDKYFLFQLGYLRQLAKLPPLLGSGIYVLGMYEAAQVYGQPSYALNMASGFPTDGALGIVVNTIFGPVEAAYAYGDTGHRKFFFRIGRLF
jgi:hypothetical protein